MRKCTICNELKSLDEFYKNYYRCKPCYKQSSYYKKRKKLTIEYQKKWVKNNPEKYKKAQEKFYLNNPGYMNSYMKKRRKDSIFKISQNLRIRLGNVIRQKKYTKNNHLYKVLGVSWEEFKLHIESQFKEGMNWGNYGKWEIDHKIPLDIATNGDEVLNLFNYKNLQPLWLFENRSKKNQIK